MNSEELWENSHLFILENCISHYFHKHYREIILMFFFSVHLFTVVSRFASWLVVRSSTHIMLWESEIIPMLYIVWPCISSFHAFSHITTLPTTPVRNLLIVLLINTCLPCNSCVVICCPIDPVLFQLEHHQQRYEAQGPHKLFLVCVNHSHWLDAQC